MKYADRITFDPEQCGGRLCLRHYRIRVKDVLEMLAAGMSESEIAVLHGLEVLTADVDHFIAMGVNARNPLREHPPRA